MSNEPTQPRPVSLPVLPTSNKVEQLRNEPPSGKVEPAVSQAAHVNKTPSSQNLTDEQKLLEQKIVEALRSIYDPEIPVNIYDLGLIYDIDLLPENHVYIRMTLTAPGCPVAGQLVSQVEIKVENVPGVKRCNVDLVWDPPWNKEMMSEVARLELGFL